MAFDDHFGIKSDQNYLDTLKQNNFEKAPTAAYSKEDKHKPQYETQTSSKKATSSQDSYIDKQYFESIEALVKTHTSSQSKRNQSESISTRKLTPEGRDDFNMDNFIDNQYFGSQQTSSKITPNKEPQLTSNFQEKPSVDKSKRPKRNDFNFIDQEYFAPINEGENIVKNEQDFEQMLPSYKFSPDDNDSLHRQPNIDLNKRWGDRLSRTDKKIDFTEKLSAKDYAKKIRQSNNLNPHLTPIVKNNVDSEGFRVPTERKYRFEYMTKEEVISLLLKCVLTDKDDVIAINKPYGLPIQGGPGHPFNIADLLPDLASRLRLTDDLHTVHRLDKETTGVLLLAKTKSMAHTLREAFNKSWIQKTYLCVTVNTPQPSEGLIDIPLKDVEIGQKGIRKMMLRPKYNADHSEFSDIMEHYGSSGSHTALTYYNVLNSSRSAALVQCNTLTGVKHQIRVHLSMGMKTPILGDHKYSQTQALAPQRLPLNLLKTLNIRQSKARYLSLHLHAQRLVLDPDMDPVTFNLAKQNVKNFTPPPKDTPRLNFFAPLPNFFMDNLRRLDLLKNQKLLKLLRSRVI